MSEPWERVGASAHEPAIQAPQPDDLLVCRERGPWKHAGWTRLSDAPFVSRGLGLLHECRHRQGNGPWSSAGEWKPARASYHWGASRTGPHQDRAGANVRDGDEVGAVSWSNRTPLILSSASELVQALLVFGPHSSACVPSSGAVRALRYARVPGATGALARPARERRLHRSPRAPRWLHPRRSRADLGARPRVVWTLRRRLGTRALRGERR